MMREEEFEGETGMGQCTRAKPSIIAFIPPHPFLSHSISTPRKNKESKLTPFFIFLKNDSFPPLPLRRPMRCSKAFQTPEINFCTPENSSCPPPPPRRILQCERGKGQILDHTEIGGYPVHTTYISIPHDNIYLNSGGSASYLLGIAYKTGAGLGG